MLLKEAVEKAIKKFFKTERPKILKSIRQRLRQASVLIHFKGIDGYGIWCGEGKVTVEEENGTLTDGLYYLTVYHSGNININEEKIEESKQEVHDKNLRKRLADLFEKQMGGEKREYTFYDDLFEKEVQEILKGFLYTKAAKHTFLITGRIK